MFLSVSLMGCTGTRPPDVEFASTKPEFIRAPVAQPEQRVSSDYEHWNGTEVTGADYNKWNTPYGAPETSQRR